MKGQDTRVTKIEQHSHGGEVHVVGIGSYKLTPEQRQAEIDATRAKMAPGDDLIVIRYTEDWRGHDEKPTAAD